MNPTMNLSLRHLTLVPLATYFAFGVFGALGVFGVFGVCAVTQADEVIISDTTLQEEAQLGDYHFSSYHFGSSEFCQFQKKSNSNSIDGSQGREISAGDLWSFFDSQGLQSVDSLVICLDVDRFSTGEAFGLESFELSFD